MSVTLATGILADRPVGTATMVAGSPGMGCARAGSMASITTGLAPLA